MLELIKTQFEIVIYITLARQDCVCVAISRASTMGRATVAAVLRVGAFLSVCVLFSLTSLHVFARRLCACLHCIRLI